MHRLLLVVLAAALVSISQAQTHEHFVEMTKQLEAAIPGYSGAYYDRESKTIVVRIVPALNPKIMRQLGRRADSLPVGRELRLPKNLAKEYVSAFRSIRLGPSRSHMPDPLSHTPVRFEVGKYTWSQVFTWRKIILRFRNNKKSMAPYGYAVWPDNCTIYYVGMRDIIKDRDRILLHETCDEAFVKALFLALKNELGIPPDAVTIWRVPNWTAEPLVGPPSTEIKSGKRGGHAK